MLISLDEAIEHCEKVANQQTVCADCKLEHIQFARWLSTLKEYYKRDTPMKIQKGSLSGRYECPECGEMMAMGIEDGFCNRCGQAVTL